MRRAPLPPTDLIRTLPPDGGSEFNRLIFQTSPYLLQHARNPVDWRPWGEEAKALARAENKPIFLSVGYSSCHWCHVMEHESFENKEIAELLNRHFIPVKVDREERPDLDDLYMLATQLMTGRGGWPNSVWLLPDGRPWYAGTYFPPEDRGPQIGFKNLLIRLAEIWSTRRTDVEEQARQLTEAIARHAAAPGAAETVSVDDLLEQALSIWRDTYDLQHGGFGDAPKFPPHTALDLLLDLAATRGDQSLLNLATGTLDAIARGGIRDHIGGGFHRYSTDARWLLPHFEKMLYDNAQLAWAFTRAHRLTRRADYAEAARTTLDWIAREMRGPEGGFFSALDADCDGEEGRFYVWRHEEIVNVLGPEKGALFCRQYQIHLDGNYHDEATGRRTGFNIPHLDDWIPLAEADRLRAARARLLECRNQRIWPGLDDKRLTGWNGLAIKAFAAAARTFDDAHYLEVAQGAARFLLRDLVVDGELMRVWRADRAHVPAFLEDYAGFVVGLLHLHRADGSIQWLEAAHHWAKRMSERFQDPDTGRLHPTGVQNEPLLARLPDVFDQAMPSSTSMAIEALVELSELSGEEALRDAAAKACRAALPLSRRYPAGCAALLKAASHLDSDAGREPFVSVSLRPDCIKLPASGEFSFQVDLSLPAGWQLRSDANGQDFHVEAGEEITILRVEDRHIAARVNEAQWARRDEADIAITLQLCTESECLPPHVVRRKIVFQR